MKRNTILKTAAGIATLAVVGPLMIGSCQYGDLPGASGEKQVGTAKNSLAAVVSGLVASNVYGNARVDLEMQRTFFPDARVTGTTTEDSISTEMNVLFGGSSFEAKRNANGYFEGEVHKSEFNWKVEQDGITSYHINRFALKLDNTLHLRCKGGIISGEYIRPMAFDWQISGTYKENGDVKIKVEVPAGLDFVLDGKVSPK